jgi:hypothetical protein
MASCGILTDFIHFNFTVPFSYVTKNNFTGPKLGNVLLFLAAELLLGSFVAVPAALYHLLRRHNRGLLLAALLIPVAWLSVLIPGKNFAHYFVVLMPFLAIMTGIGVARFSELQGSWRFAACGLSLAVLVLYGYMAYPYYFAMTPGQLSEYKYGTTFIESEKLAEYLRKRTKAGEVFFQWGFRPELYFLTGTRAPLPFAMSVSPFFMPDPQRAVGEMMEKLTADPPRYMIYEPKWARTPGKPEIDNFIASLYVSQADFGSTIIFRRKDLD